MVLSLPEGWRGSCAGIQELLDPSGPLICAQSLAKLPGRAGGGGGAMLVRSSALSQYHHLQQSCFFLNIFLVELPMPWSLSEPSSFVVLSQESWASKQDGLQFSCPSLWVPSSLRGSASCSFLRSHNTLSGTHTV